MSPIFMERDIEAQPASVIVGCHRAVQSGGLRPDRQHTTLSRSTRKVFSSSGPFPEKKKKKQKSVSKALAMHGWFSLLSPLTTKTETSATSLGAQRRWLPAGSLLSSTLEEGDPENSPPTAIGFLPAPRARCRCILEEIICILGLLL